MDYEDYDYPGTDYTLKKILEKDITKQIKKFVLSFWKDKKRFPAPQPVSIERKDFETLKNNNYAVCAKLDGNRFLLACTTINFSENIYNVCCLIDRNFNIFLVEQKLQGDWIYDYGSLFDGELCPNKYVIHDAISIGGFNMMKKTFNERWSEVNNLLTYCYTPNNHPFDIYLKTFYNLKQIEGLFSYINKCEIPNDGLVFYPIEEEVGTGTQYSLFKWKPEGHHTIDFLVKVSKNKKENVLYCWSRGKNKKFGSTKNITLNNKSIPNNSVVEYKCEIVGKDYNFIPIRLRNDKPNGNNLLTVEKTILNIRENIKREEFIKI
tara:strand:- start:172 stop:1134 length:963 start_codon:yes stop_codon:yes gene_type:complete